MLPGQGPAPRASGSAARSPRHPYAPGQGSSPAAPRLRARSPRRPTRRPRSRPRPRLRARSPRRPMPPARSRPRPRLPARSLRRPMLRPRSHRRPRRPPRFGPRRYAPAQGLARAPGSGKGFANGPVFRRWSAECPPGARQDLGSILMTQANCGPGPAHPIDTTDLYTLHSRPTKRRRLSSRRSAAVVVLPHGEDRTHSIPHDVQ